MTKILVLCHAIVGSKMASPGMRSYNIARVLQKHLPEAEVTLVLPRGLPSDIDPASVDFKVAKPDQRTLSKMVGEADIIVSAKFPLKLLPFARKARRVLDLYTPFFTEWMEMSKGDPSKTHRKAWIEPKRKNLMAQIAAADLILCSNVRQRDLVTGIMGTLGFITPRAYDEDPTLERLIKIAPLGTRDIVPHPGAPLMKGVIPGIRETDTVLLWNGTIVEWYDLDVLIRAMHRLSLERDDIKLVFMGTEHPDSFGAKPLEGLGGGATRAAIAQCEELGILDKSVFFNFGWASNAETEQYLLESDIGVCTYFDGLETRYSFRVRYLDLFWGELPIICTRGDVVSEMVDNEPLGISVPETDLDALVDAIRRLTDDEELRARCKQNLHRLREQYTWDNTLQPLIEFCRNPETTLSKPSERLLPLAFHTLDWLASQAHYNVRYGLRAKLREMRRARQ